jgi:integrase
LDRRLLTNRMIAALPAAEKGRRLEIYDTKVDRLLIRTTDTGAKSFVLYTVFPSDRFPTRRRLGRFPTMTIESARKKARTWLDLVAENVDPEIAEERRRREEQAARSNSFSHIAREYIKHAVIGAGTYKRVEQLAKVYREDKAHRVNGITDLGLLSRVLQRNRALGRMRKAHSVIRVVDGELIPVWGGRPIVSITPKDIRAVVGGVVKRGAPYHAANVLRNIKMIFGWVEEREDEFGLIVNPAAKVRMATEVGGLPPRDRVLNDRELRAYWGGASSLGYPYTAIFHLLALTGLRKNDVVEAQWSEFDLSSKIWTVPAERAKMKKAHVVPLVNDALDILGHLPRLTNGDHLFSFKFGKRPVSNLSKVKRVLDQKMREAIGDFPPFVIHDVRRTVRTRLSAPPLRVLPHVAEAVIGHTQGGLFKIYNQYDFHEEKVDALQRWSDELRRIVNA